MPKLHPAQEEIKAQRRRFNVVCCGRRFGKDILGMDILVEYARKGCKIGWFQPTYKNLLEVWRVVKRIFKPLTVGVSEQEKWIELRNGTVIDFWSLDGDPEACRGRKYHVVLVNEAAKARYLSLAWEYAIRLTLADFQGSGWFLSTPRGRDFFWQLFERGNPENGDRDPDWVSWQKPTSANTTIPNLAAEIETMRRELPPLTFAQEVEAKFLDSAGRFFDEWEPTRDVLDYDEATGEVRRVKLPWHVVSPFAIPDHWRVWGAVDYGTSKNSKSFCFLLLAADEEGGVVVVDEVYESGLLAEAQAEKVLACLEKHGMAWPAHPDRRDGLWETRVEVVTFDWANTFPPEDPEQRAGKYPVEWYWERGLPCVRAVKDRKAGWQEVKQWLHRTIKVRDEAGEEDVRPALRVFAGRCSNLIRTIELMVPSEKDLEELDQTLPEQHPSDTLRYGLMTRPEASGPNPKTVRPPDEYEVMEQKAQARKARHGSQGRDRGGFSRVSGRR